MKTSLKTIYYNFKEEEYIKYKESFTSDIFYKELNFLEEQIFEETFDLNLIYFYIEKLNENIFKHSIVKFASVLLKILQAKEDEKFALFQIKILKILNKLPFYAPIGIQIISLMKKFINREITDKIEFDEDRLKVDNRILGSADFHNHVYGESLNLLKDFLNKYSNCAGFVEMGEVFKEELSIYSAKEEIKLFIEILSAHINYIKKERESMEGFERSDFEKFEKQIKKMF